MILSRFLNVDFINTNQFFKYYIEIYGNLVFGIEDFGIDNFEIEDSHNIKNLFDDSDDSQNETDEDENRSEVDEQNMLYFRCSYIKMKTQHEYGDFIIKDMQYLPEFNRKNFTKIYSSEENTRVVVGRLSEVCYLYLLSEPFVKFL